MLVLSRCRDESIIIGEAGQVLSAPIIITLVDLRGDKARIGIQAPTEVTVHRQEVYEAIQRENMRVSGQDVNNLDVSMFPNRRKKK